MKLSRKNLGRVATTFLATAMLASLTAVPAMATDGVQGSTEETISSVQITKKLTMPVDVVTSEKMTFDFTLSGATATNETIVSDDVTLDVTSGTGTATGTATFEAGVANGATQTVTFDISGFTFATPGVYKYTIDEAEVSNPNYDDTTGSLTAYLFVKDTNGAEANGNKPYAVVVKNSAGTTKTEIWENSYLTAATNKLTVNKVIEGDMASPNDVFNFTVSGLTGGRTYTLEGTNITTGENDTIAANDDGTVTFTLKGGENWTIKGLVGGTYTVTEADNNEGYTLTEMTNDTDEVTAGAQILVDGTNDETTFTNTRNAVSPTGIAMDIAPYALLVVIAAAGCFVFLRKRNED